MFVRRRVALPTAWRSPGRLQLGLGESALVVEGLTDAEEQLVAALPEAIDGGDLRVRAADLGIGEVPLARLLDHLTRAGALVASRPPAAAPGGAAAAAVLDLAHPHLTGPGVLAARRGALVRVSGASLTGVALARTLAAGGVGSIVLDDDEVVTDADVAPGFFAADDVGLPRGQAAGRLVAALSPNVRVAAAGSAGEADVTVLLGSGAVELARAEALQREERRHLAITWRGAEVIVGPLVHPGSSACLRCVETHRSDRDPAWPRILRQVARPAGSRDRPEEPALATLAGSLAACQVLADLDAAAGSGAAALALGATLEVSLATAAVAPRRWDPHPRCGCIWGG